MTGYQSDVQPNVYDSFMNFKNDEINFEKIIDMNDNMIIGVKNADRDKGAVNLKQVTDLLNNRFLALISQINTKQNKSYYAEIFETFFDITDPNSFILSDTYGAEVKYVKCQNDNGYIVTETNITVKMQFCSIVEIA